MGAPTQSPPPVPTGPPSLVSTLVVWITGITTWSRAGIAIVLGFAALSGMLVYRNPQQTFELLSAAFRPAPPAELPYMTPLYTDVSREVENLTHTLAQDLIAIGAFRVNILTNQQTLVVAYATPPYEGSVQAVIADWWGQSHPAFRDDPVVNHILVRLYLGRFVCVPPHDTWRVPKRLGASELCFIGVPPDGVGLAGYIAGAWDQPLTPERQEQVEIAFRNASEVITWHRRQRREQ